MAAATSGRLPNGAGPAPARQSSAGQGHGQAAAAATAADDDDGLALQAVKLSPEFEVRPAGRLGAAVMRERDYASIS